MARNQQPVTAEELEQAKTALENLRGDVRQALADEFGGDPEDYRADRAVTDGGDDSTKRDE